jgi:hypothetical protein
MSQGESTTYNVPEFSRVGMARAGNAVENVYNTHTPTYYGGQTYADFSPQTQQGLGQVENLAMSGGPAGVASTLGEYDKTMRGDYLYGGPGFDRAMEAAYRKINPMVDSRFSGSGRYTSGLAEGEKMARLGDAFAGLYGDERNRMMGYAGMSPTMENLGYSAPQRLMGVGAAYEGQEQRGIDEAMARHDFAQQVPYMKLQNYFPYMMDYGNYGAMQGAQGGAALGSAAGPYGMAAGAIIGGVAGASN